MTLEELTPPIDWHLIGELEKLLEIREITYKRVLEEGRADKPTCSLMYRSLKEAIQALKREDTKMSKPYIILLLNSQIERYKLANNMRVVELLEKAIDSL